jgi:3,4-dihydroxy 2-butanone 4-phosphate synthase/GTP cyclohydrolase II
MVAEEGRGVVVLLREANPTSLSSRLAAEGEKPPQTIRDYGVGAQILLDLGVKNMILLTNSPKTVVGLEGYGLSILGHRPIKR